MSPRLKSSLVLAAVFLLGAATGGGVVTATNARQMGRRLDTPPRVLKQRFLLAGLEHEVGLDPEQLRKAEALVDVYQTEQQGVRREVDPRMVALRARLLDDLKALIRPDQLAGYQRFVRRVEKAEARRRGP